ncbi:hypothetical protein SLE2022_356350 [Rubroshorea leprosula]
MSAICGAEEQNQCSPRMTRLNNAPPRAEASGKREAQGSSASRKGKQVPQTGAVNVNVGTQEGFHQMELSDMRPQPIHNVVPSQFHNMMPTMFNNVTSTHFHTVAATHLHENPLQR